VRSRRLITAGAAALLVATAVVLTFRAGLAQPKADGWGRSVPVVNDDILRLSGVHSWRFVVAPKATKATVCTTLDGNPNATGKSYVGLTAKPDGSPHAVLVVVQFEPGPESESPRLGVQLMIDGRATVGGWSKNFAKGLSNRTTTTRFPTLERHNSLMVFNDPDGKPRLEIALDIE